MYSYLSQEHLYESEYDEQMEFELCSTISHSTLLTHIPPAHPLRGEQCLCCDYKGYSFHNTATTHKDNVKDIGDTTMRDIRISTEVVVKSVFLLLGRYLIKSLKSTPPSGLAACLNANRCISKTCVVFAYINTNI